MKNRVKIITLALLVSLVPTALSAQSVVTTTGWTAAFAELAGADEVQILAPMDMKHPPEYEISLKELQMVAQADYLVFAGYEAMMGRIKESMGSSSSVQMVQINTGNGQQNIRAQVMKIAEALGTEAKAEKNLETIDTFFEFWRKDLTWHEAELASSAVHFHQQALAGSLGFHDYPVFGPAPPALGVIREVLQTKPLLIIDNYHNPVASAFLEMDDQPKVVSWLNFPGLEGTESLLDVLEYNRNALNRVLE
ncbi:MAG: hypothetical protein PQJ50_13045 [Spirochaetales bacterium]|nr:hypothetical protein [Spirochaetales bacterium]